MASIGYATLQVIPSMRGTAAALTSESGAVGTQAATAFGGGFNRVLSGGLIAAGVVAATGVALVAIGSQFDDAYDRIQTGTGATGDALEGLKDVFRDVVADVPTDFASASEAITLLNQRLELTGQPLERLSEQFLELSRITDTDLRGNIDSVTRAFGDWSVSTEDQSAALDRFFRASQASGVAVSDLAEGVVQFGSPLRQLGFSLDESIALFASFGEAGVNTSTVMSGMRQAVKNFASGLAENELGVTSFSDVLWQVEHGMFTLNDAMTLFGTRAGPDMFAALTEGRFELEDFLGAMNAAGGGIMETAESTRDFGESFTILKNNLMLLLEGPASALMGWVSDVADGFVSLVAAFQGDGISGVVERLQENFANLSPNMQAVAIGAGVLAVALLAVGVAAAVSALGFLAIPLAIALVAAGLVYAYTQFEGFRNVVDSVVAWITGTAIPAIVAFAGFVREAFSNVDWAGVWQTIVNAVTTAFTTIQTVVSGVISVVQGLWSVFGSTIVSLAQTAWSTVTGVITSAVDIILGIWNVFAGVFTGDWSRVWNGLTAVVAGVWNAMMSLVEGAWNALFAVVRLGLTALRAAWDAGWEAVKSVVRAAWEGIKSAVSAGISAVVSFLTALPGRAVSAIASIVSGLTNKGREAMQGLFDAIQTVWGNIRGWLSALPGRIVSAVGSLARVLYDAGRAAIQSLWDGMQAIADGMISWAQGIADTIGGILSGLNPFESATFSVTTAPTAGSTISAFPLEAVSSRYAGQNTDARIVIDANGVDTALVEWLRRSVRVESGGNVQAYLGA